jgi:AcrR family transcriptional regulator
MPKPFSASERAAITAALLSHGRRLFAAQGLRKTSVEELAAAAGISKGAFYLFFESKEELFFELLERYEASYKDRLLARIAETTLPPRARMRALLADAVDTWKRDPIFTRFSGAEYEQLLRRLPPARVAAHAEGDDQFAVVFAAAWAAQGVVLREPPDLVSGLLRALFFVSMHEAEFAPAAYAQVMETMMEMLADRLVPEERDDPRQ